MNNPEQCRVCEKTINPVLDKTFKGEWYCYQCITPDSKLALSPVAKNAPLSDLTVEPAIGWVAMKNEELGVKLSQARQEGREDVMLEMERMQKIRNELGLEEGEDLALLAVELRECFNLTPKHV